MESIPLHNRPLLAFPLDGAAFAGVDDGSAKISFRDGTYNILVLAGC